MNPMGHHAHSQKSSSKVLKTVPPTLSHSTPPLPFAGTSVSTAYPKATLRSAEHLVLFSCGAASGTETQPARDRSLTSGRAHRAGHRDLRLLGLPAPRQAALAPPHGAVRARVRCRQRVRAGVVHVSVLRAAPDCRLADRYFELRVVADLAERGAWQQRASDTWRLAVEADRCWWGHGPLSVLVAIPRPEVGDPSHRMFAMIVPSLFSTSCASSIPQRLLQSPGPLACTASRVRPYMQRLLLTFQLTWHVPAQPAF